MIRGSQGDHDKAFVNFLKHHDARLQAGAGRHAFYVRDPAVGRDDILADAALRAYKQWNELDPSWDDERRIAWLLTIMHNVAYERRRVAVRRDDSPTGDLGEVIERRSARAASSDPTCDAVEARLNLDRLSAALDQLTPKARELWTTYHSGAEIGALADVMCCPESTIRSQLSRINARLAMRLSTDASPFRTEEVRPDEL